MKRYITYVIIFVAFACVGGWLGMQRANDELIRPRGTWQVCDLPDGYKADHFVIGSSHFVYIETTEGAIASESLISAGWEVVTSTARIPWESWFTGKCAVTDTPRGREDLPGQAVELLNCTYNVHPETGGILDYAILTDGTVWRWVPRDQEKHPYVSFIEAFASYPLMYAGVAWLISVVVVGIFEIVSHFSPHYPET